MKIMERMLNNMLEPTERMNRLRDRLMEMLFDEKIMDSIIGTTHIDTMHNSSNNTNITLIERVINKTEKTKDASVFDVEKREIIETALMDEVRTIISWMAKPENKTLNLTVNADKCIGHGITYRSNQLKEYTTQDITLVLIKDYNNPACFRCITAYPDITSKSKTRTPTGRNLIPDLSQTRTFRKSNTAERKTFIDAAIKGMGRKLEPMEQVYADIVTDPSFNDRMDISFNGSEITIRQLYELGHSTLHITPDKVNITSKTAPAPETINLKKLAQNRLNTYLGKNFDTTEPKKPTPEQKVAMIEARFGNISTQETDDCQRTLGN